MRREYYWEYLQECDNLIEKFMKEGERISPKAFCIEEINLGKPVANYLWEMIFFNRFKEIYSHTKMRGENHSSIVKIIWHNVIEPFLPSGKEVINSRLFQGKKPVYDCSIKKYENKELFFCSNFRQLSYFIPLLNKADNRAVVVAMEGSIEESLFDYKGDLLEVNLILKPLLLRQQYMNVKFRYIYLLANTFYILLKEIMPSCVFVMEGCHYETETIAAVCRSLKIKSICMQQGWPGLIHTRFKNMSYDYFLTWGKGFSELWKQHNPKPVYLESGYLYPVIHSTTGSKSCITFFFQAPSFVLGIQTLRDMIAFAFYCARTFPERKIYIREHPEYNLSDLDKAFITVQPNIKIVSKTPLKEVFAETELGVAVFSSTLIEGIIHDVIPFVFNLTSMPNYYPDVAKEDIGVEAKSMEEAQEKMCNLINDRSYRTRIKDSIQNVKKEYFGCVKKDSIDSIIGANFPSHHLN